MRRTSPTGDVYRLRDSFRLRLDKGKVFTCHGYTVLVRYD